MNHYKTAISANATDEDAYYAIGLCYLQLGLYDLAIKNFQKAIEFMPAHADAYYYLGLSMIRGRRPKTLSLSEVRFIEKNVNTAIQLNSGTAKYYYLAAILTVDYYLANGLTVPGPPLQLLLELAERADHDPWEVERLLHSILLRDSQLISRIRRNDQMHAG